MLMLNSKMWKCIVTQINYQNYHFLVHITVIITYLSTDQVGGNTEDAIRRSPPWILPPHCTATPAPHQGRPREESTLSGLQAASTLCPTPPPPPYPSLLSCISVTMLVRRCLHRTSPLSHISTVPPLASSRVSVAVIIALSSIVLCTSPPSFVYLLGLDLLLALRCYLLYYLLRTTFLTLLSDLLTMIFSSLLARLLSLHSDLPRFSPPDFTLLCSNLINPLKSVWSDMLAPSLICSTLIDPLVLWSACSDLLGSACSDLLYLLFLWTF